MAADDLTRGSVGPVDQGPGDAVAADDLTRGSVGPVDQGPGDAVAADDLTRGSVGPVDQGPGDVVAGKGPDPVQTLAMDADQEVLTRDSVDREDPIQEAGTNDGHQIPIRGVGDRTDRVQETAVTVKVETATRNAVGQAQKTVKTVTKTRRSAGDSRQPSPLARLPAMKPRGNWQVSESNARPEIASKTTLVNSATKARSHTARPRQRSTGHSRPVRSPASRLANVWKA